MLFSSFDRASLSEDGPKFRAKACRNGLTRDEAEIEWIVRVMWRAFPEATSENELAEIVAAYLTRRGREVSPRTVRYWLRRETTPHWRYAVELLALAGVEKVLEFVFGTGGKP